VVMRDAMSAFEAAVAAAGQQTKPRDTSTQPPDEVWDEATDEPAVRTRPLANGAGSRPSRSRPRAAGPKPAPTATSQPASSSQPVSSQPPSAGAKPPSAGAKPPSAGGARRAAGAAKRPSGGAKKPAADPKKPVGRSGSSAAADHTSPDEPTPAKPDEPAD
jgi:hypothetical protein